jgi:hypothetical protein
MSIPMVELFLSDTSLTGTPPLAKAGGFCYYKKVVEELLMDLSELIEELREIEIYGSEPSDWMGYLGSDDYWVPDEELAY